jgi:Leucine-rich repeat (LRR) protein
LQPSVLEQLGAAFGRLKHLQVVGEICDDVPEEAREQLAALGRLLNTCKQLESVDFCLELETSPALEWLLLDPDSTTITTTTSSRSSNKSSVTGPCLPRLRKWVAPGVSPKLLGHWVTQQQQQQQQQQLGSNLREVTLACGSPQDISGLAPLTGLVALDLSKCDINAASLTALSHMSRLTRLGLYGGEEEAAAACGLPGLRELHFYDCSWDDEFAPDSSPLIELPSSLSSLKQLSFLDISGCDQIEELPDDLGVWLPRLQRLEARHCELEVIPASLTALRHLDLTESAAWDITLSPALSNLRVLDLVDTWVTRLRGLSALTALEELDIRSSDGFKGSLDVLRPLTRLRHLAFTRDGCDPLRPSSFTVLGTLQQLTHLSIGPNKNTAGIVVMTSTSAGPGHPYVPTERPQRPVNPSLKEPCFLALASTPPLPHLQQLDISGAAGKGALAALGPWLVQLPALTQLKMASVPLWAAHRELQRLPVQLRELDLKNTGLEEPPGCITRLTALEVLRIGGEGRLVDLARWRCASSRGRMYG